MLCIFLCLMDYTINFGLHTHSGLIWQYKKKRSDWTFIAVDHHHAFPIPKHRRVRQFLSVFLYHHNNDDDDDYCYYDTHSYSRGAGVYCVFGLLELYLVLCCDLILLSGYRMNGHAVKLFWSAAYLCVYVFNPNKLRAKAPHTHSTHISLITKFCPWETCWRH